MELYRTLTTVQSTLSIMNSLESVHYRECLVKIEMECILTSYYLFTRLLIVFITLTLTTSPSHFIDCKIHFILNNSITNTISFDCLADSNSLLMIKIENRVFRIFIFITAIGLPFSIFFSSLQRAFIIERVDCTHRRYKSQQDLRGLSTQPMS